MIDQLAIESTSLSSVERSELDEYELIIASGERVFVTVGNALIVIRDKRLYRENHGTFEQYLSNKWPNISRRRAYQLMDAAVVAEDVKHVSHPLNERQALELLGVAPEERPTMLRRAIETAPNGKVTAAHIDQVIKEKAFPYACETCNERFSVPVWHCPGCAHHYHEQDSDAATVTSTPAMVSAFQSRPKRTNSIRRWSLNRLPINSRMSSHRLTRRC